MLATMSTEEQRRAWREHMAAYRAAHPDVISAAKARDYQRHREARVAQMREYREANQEAISERRKAERLADPAKYKAINRARYERSRDAILAAQKADPKRREYQAEYRNRPRAHATAWCWHANRRAERYGIPGRLTADDVLPLAGPCHYCGGEAGGWDHVVPLFYGGANEVSNLVPSCFTCNRKKGRRRPKP